MELWQSLVLGIVEGLTEFLPISSTGHLILASDLMGLREQKGIESFEIGIQSGAIFAVILLYRQKLLGLLSGVFKRDPKSLRDIGNLLIAFFPMVLIGVAFGSQIKELLFGPLPVISALALGGLVMIAFERRMGKNVGEGRSEVSHWREALGIGCFQCLALWPGTSRAMATIFGGRLMGLSASASAEFSFLLAVPTLIGAGVYDFLKHAPEILAAPISGTAWAIGFLSAFVSAWLVVRWFISFLGKHSLEVFGWYRIILALIYGFIFLK